MTSSIYPQVFTIATPNIPTNTNIITGAEGGIPITRELVRPGGGGILRLLFSFTLNATALISVFNNSVLKGILNADNSSEIVTNGYYRFDIDVEEGDVINLQSSQIISNVNFLRAHLVQFGA